MGKKYYGLDIGKFICALLIISSHFASEWGHFSKSVDMLFSIYIIAVPFFFAVSGFLLFNKIENIDATQHKGVLIKYLKKIVLMYLMWSVIYIAFNVATFCKFGVTSQEVIGYIHQCIVYSTYDTIWFLPALGVGVVMVYFMRKVMSFKNIMIVAIVFYIIGILGVTYSGLMVKSELLSTIYGAYEKVFLTTRNCFFNGFPFVALGAYIAYEVNHGKYKKANLKYAALCAVFGILFVAEAFATKKLLSAPNANTVFMLLPFVYFAVKFLLGVNIPDNKICYVLRKLSTTMFLSQRIFLTALPVLFPNSVFENLLSFNSFGGLIYIIVITIAFSALLTFLGNHNKIVRLMV